ncbi:MAG: hypothetical protein IT279_13165 [Ignavibacteriaceae bacterium]|nr:hypothetical protein [Ignavibacteriaceae bacterium]
MIKIALFFLIIISSLFPQEIQFKTRVDSSSYLVGDPVTLLIDTKYPTDFRMVFPSRYDSLAPLEYLYTDTLSLDESAGQKSGKFAFVVAGYDSGLFTIPRLPFLFVKGNSTQTFLSDSFQVLISTVAVDTSKDIRDIKAPEKIPFDYSFLLWLIPLLILLGALGYWLYKRFSKREKTATPVPQAVLSPYEEAYSALQSLEKKQLWQSGQIKEFHSEITGIIRNYFERAYTMPALESTSSETLEFLKKKGVSHTIVSRTESFLKNADLVKFAKYIPLSDLNQKMMTTAYDILKESSGGEEVLR